MSSKVRFDQNKFRNLFSYLAAGCLGLLAFFVAFPAYILDPTYLDWVYPRSSPSYNFGDFHTHYLGWLFLRHSPWSFPLGNISNYVAPLNTYIAYTDSIPLMAFPLRLIAESLPADFQYLGLWSLLCFILQGVFALRLLRPWIKDPVCLAVSVTLLTFSPILIYRYFHVALLSHWLLLWSLAVVQENFMAARDQKNLTTPIVKPMVIIVLATLIQPYLAAMVAGICWAIPLGKFLNDRQTNSKFSVQQLLPLGSVTIAYILPMASILYVFGFLNGPSGSGGFHFFGTDFFSLFNNYGTSSFIPKFRNKRGLYEGYAWPGLGGWTLIIACLVPRIRHEIKDWAKLPYIKAILITIGLMWFFALSENIHFFSFWLIDMEWFWKPFKFITSSLRTSGRFIWPLYYVLLIAAFSIAANRYAPKFARRLFAVAIILQIIDLGPWMANRGSRFTLHRGPALTDPFWSKAATTYKQIKMIPPEQHDGFCKEYDGSYYYEWVEFADFAAKNKLSINSGYLARYDRWTSVLYCGAQLYEFLTGPLQPDSLYIVRQEFRDRLPTSGPDRRCEIYDGHMACFATTQN